MHTRKWEDTSPLCCCEYIDHKGDRNHILACCCNCEEFDHCCDRLIFCRGTTKSELSTVMYSCLDRLRFPYKGGALKITFEMSPFLIHPLLVLIAIQSFHNLVFVLCAVPVFLIYSTYYFTKHQSSSLFFFYWMFSTVIYTVLVYEFYVIPQLVIFPHENFELIVLSIISAIFFYLTKHTSNQFNNIVDNANGELLGNGTTQESICPVCRIKVYPRSLHCHICQICIPKYDHHCLWLNCCVGEHNQHYFMLGLLFGLSALGYGSMLSLTSICSPVFFLGILVPNDCSDVLTETEWAVSFVTAAHCLQLAFIMLFVLLHHAWLVTRGFSSLEWRQLPTFSICSSSPYSRGIFKNWIRLFSNFGKVRL